MKSHTFTFPQQAKQQVAAGTTSFSFSGTGTLSNHWYPTGGKIEQRKYCSNYKGGTKTPQKGRSLSITVKFIGYYGADPNNEQKVEITLPLTQDTADQMRQEYIDQSIFVPEHSEFGTVTQGYNHGHYDKMMDGGLSTYKANWLEKCNELHRQCSETYHCTHKTNGKTVCKPPNCPVAGCTHQEIADFTLADFNVASGYRNPHHNRYHVKISSLHPHGLHQYGYALDITTPDIDGDGTAEQVYLDEAKSADGIAMSDAAEAAGAGYHPSWKKYGNITHGDWRADYKTPWPPNNNSSVPLVSEAPELPSSVIYACSFHSGAQTLSDNHGWVTPLCNRSEHANYQCQLTFSDHALQTSCSVTNSDGDYCTATYFYLCDSHTHEYPSSSLAACGIHPASASGDHTSTYVCDISPCSNRVVPYCLALCPETSSHGTTTITGGDEDTSGDEDALAACSVHPASASGDHSMQASCSYADRFGDSCAITNFYACDNHVHFINTALLMGACGRHWVPSRLLSAHFLQASCSTINSNGDSCTVTSFYACYNHTHTYPAP